MNIYLNTVHNRQQTQQNTHHNTIAYIVHSGYVNRFRNYNTYQQKRNQKTLLHYT